MFYELNTFFGLSCLICVFVGKKFLVGIFGRFVGFECVCFMELFFFGEKTKLLKEKDKKTREKK